MKIIRLFYIPIFFCFSLAITSCNFRVVHSSPAMHQNYKGYWKRFEKPFRQVIPDSLLAHFSFNRSDVPGENTPMSLHRSFPVEYDERVLFLPYVLVEIDSLGNAEQYFLFKEIIKQESLTATFEDIFYLPSDYVMDYLTSDEIMDLFPIDMVRDTAKKYAFPFIEDSYNGGILLIDETNKSDIDIYILNNGRKCALKNNAVIYSWEQLPEDKRHGYTSGIYFHDVLKRIVYWTIAW